jgi:hypothetical protein
VRRVIAIFLGLVFAALGSGALNWLHDRAHDRQDAIADARLAGEGQTGHHRPHDESNCDLHALLRAPITSTAWVPLLVFLGIFVAFLTQLAPSPLNQPTLCWIDCRGPPAC